jgi:hypothetical protein
MNSAVFSHQSRAMDTLHRYTDLPDTVNSLFWVYHSLTVTPVPFRFTLAISSEE